MKCQVRTLFAWPTALASLLLSGALRIASAANDDLPPLPVVGNATSSYQNATEVYRDDSDCRPGLYALKETLFWCRTAGTNRDAVIRVTDESTTSPGTLVLSTSDLASTFQPGVRVVVGWRQDANRAFELSYFGIFDWHAAATAHGNNDLALPGDLGLASLDFYAADQIKLTHRSQLNNAEANVIHTDGQLSLLSGLRYLSLYDKLDIRSTDLDAGTSDYSVYTTNNLFGGQLGTRFYRSYGRFAWDATGKAGIFGNGASQWQFVTDSPPGSFLRERHSASGVQAAFVGDINISGYYRLFSFFTLRAGYNLLLVEGVALAPGQLDFTSTAASGTDLRSGDGFFAHGVSAGGLADW